MIKDTVGLGGKNYSLDVARVQKLLNQNLHHLKRTSLLSVDGEAGEKTIRAIQEYQVRVLKYNEPSGLIEPDRNTIKWMMKTARKLRPQHVDTFIIKILPAAKKIRSKYQIPVSVIMAQAALDSEWGKKIHNQAYYSIGKINLVSKPIDRPCHAEAFDHFANIYDACENFGHYLKSNPRYLTAFRYTNKPLLFAKLIQDIGETDIFGYVREVHSTITKYHLIEFDK